MRRALVVATLLVLFGALRWSLQRPIGHDPGVLVAEAPRQTAPRDRRAIRHGDYALTPLADFELEARVLSRADYSRDAGSSLAPMDLALGWGRMSDSAIIDQLDISQAARFYSYRWRQTPPLPLREIVRSSANMHLIPADDAIERALGHVRAGMIVTLHGQLVDARRADGFRWTSSLTREDSGGGACELVLVDHLDWQ